MASAASRGAATAFLESFADIRARDEQRGSDAGEQTAGDSNGQGEAERADVQANGVPTGNKFGHIGRHVLEHQRELPVGQKQAKNGPDEREQDALDEQLTN